MDFKYHIESAWNLTLKNIVSLILLTLVFLGVNLFTLGILGPVAMAGFVHSLLLLSRNGREPKVQDLFAHMHLFLPLLGFSIMVFLAALIGMMIFFVGMIIVLAVITFCCIYMLPLMTDKHLGLMDAIKESYAMAKKGEIMDHVVVAIIYMAITMIGGSVLIGLLFAMPLATLFLVSTYEEKLRVSPPAPPQTQ